MMAIDPFQLGALGLERAPAPAERGVVLVLIGTLLALRSRLPRTASAPLNLAREALVLAPAYLLYFFIRGLMETRDGAAFGAAGRIIELERSLGIFWEQRLQQQILRHDPLVSLVNWIYIWGHWPVIFGTLIWLVLHDRASYRRYRNAILISGALGLVIFALFPVAPPRFMADWGFVDTVTQRSHAYRVLQPPSLTNPYAAMPSLHLGWNLLIGIALFRHGARRATKLAGLLLPTAMFASIVLTANHYLLDGLGGAAVALVGLWAAVLLQHRQGQGQAREPGAPRPAPVAAAHSGGIGD